MSGAEPATSGNASQRSAPASRREAAPWLAISFAFVAALGAIGLLFVWHREQLRAELLEHYSKSAARLAKGVEQKYGSYREVLENIDRASSTLPSYRAIAKTCAQNKRCMAEKVVEVSSESLELNARGLEFVECAPLPGQTQFSSQLDEEGDALLFPLPAGAARRGEAADALCGSVALERLFPRTQALSSGGRVPRTFDDVLLLDASGKALYSAATESRVRVVALPLVAAGAGSAANVSQVLPDVQLGPTKYRAFLQPVLVKVVRAGDPTCSNGCHLVVAGLVRESRLFMEGMRVSPQAFLWLVLLVGFGVLALPLAKVWLLGPRGRLRRVDMGLLVSSALATTLIAGVLLLTIAASLRLGNRLDDELGVVAGQVRERLATSLRKSGLALDEFIRQTSALRAAVPCVEGQPLQRARGSSPADPFAKACTAAFAATPASAASCKDSAPPLLESGVRFGNTARTWPLCERTRCKLAGLGDQDGHWSAYLSDRKGHQLVKVAPDEHATPPIDVSRREYFRRARAGRLATFEPLAECPADAALSRPECQPSRGAPEIVRSATRGEMQLVVAKAAPEESPCARPDRSPSQGGGGRPGRAEVIAALALDLSAYHRSILPLGFQLAILDGSARVMLHSSNDASQGHSLLDDVGEPESLQAALAARASRLLDLEYVGTASRAQLLPVLPSLDWSIVVVAPRALVDISAGKILLSTLFCFALFVVAALLALGIVTLLGSRGEALRRGPRPPGELAARWLRPLSSAAEGYAVCGWWMWSATALLCAVPFAIPHLPLTVALALAGAAACGMISLLPGAGRPGPRPLLQRLVGWRLGGRRGADVASAYTWCWSGVVGLLVIAPAVLLFSAAYAHVEQRLVAAEWQHYEQEFRGARAPACPPSGAGGDPKCTLVFGSVRPPPLPPQATASALACALQLVPCVMDWLPALDAVQGRPRSTPPGLAVSMSSLAPWPGAAAVAWRPLPPPTSASEAPAPSGGLATGGFDLRAEQWLGLALSVLFFFVPAALISKVTLHRVLYLDLLPRALPNVGPALPSTRWPELDADERRLLAQLAWNGYANPHPENGALLLGLAEKGLLDPDSLTLRRDDAAWIKRQVQTDVLASWEATEGASAWRALRLPLLAGVGILIAVVATIQPELALAVGALVPAVGAGTALPIVLKLLESARSSG